MVELGPTGMKLLSQQARHVSEYAVRARMGIAADCRDWLLVEAVVLLVVVVVAGWCY